jgi:hypothetical protein
MTNPRKRFRALDALLGALSFLKPASKMRAFPAVEPRRQKHSSGVLKVLQKWSIDSASLQRRVACSRLHLGGIRFGG